MPVEECGNMLLMTALYAHVTGDRGFVERHRKPLAQWADYLEKVGVDPEEQLCTDDFMGHLAHNVNLSAKTICALGAYSRMCRLLNDEPKARRFGELATKMAAEWVRLADDGDHHRLAFDQPGTWSMKYNLVWDGILKLGLFPDEVVAKEIAYYLKIQNPYGLPLDNRDTLTKTDWLLWVASLSKDREDFQRFVAPVMRFLRETPHPLPFPDSYKTDTASGMWGHHPGEFHLFSRVVIGGVFIQFLQDESMWMKWAKR